MKTPRAGELAANRAQQYINNMGNDVAPTRQAVAIAAGRSAPLKVTGRLKLAIETMVWSGARRADAAKIAGLSDPRRSRKADALARKRCSQSGPHQITELDECLMRRIRSPLRP